MKRTLSLVAICTVVVLSYAAQITVGVQWKDDQGNPIHAHGGSILKAGPTFYWYGENTRNMSAALEFGAFDGIRCYSSTNLQTWHYERMACAVRPSGPLSIAGAAYRPKVLYNSSTSTYVMLITECCPTQAGLVFAKSSTPQGPFVYQSKWTDQGVMDMGAFQDDDGSAYVVFSNSNARVSIYKLSSDYLSVASKTCDIGSSCEEAPAIIKANGRYFLTTSWCTWWAPNQNHYRSATSISGPWSASPDGNLGDGTTYNSQGGFILPIAGMAGTTYIYMGDRWDCPQNACDLSMPKYVWLPITISGSTMSMAWFDAWYLDIQRGSWSTQATSATPATQTVFASPSRARALYDIRGRKAGQWETSRGVTETGLIGRGVCFAGGTSLADSRTLVCIR